MRVTYIPLPEAYDAGCVQVNLSPDEARSLLWEGENANARSQTQTLNLLEAIKSVMVSSGLRPASGKDAPR